MFKIICTYQIKAVPLHRFSKITLLTFKKLKIMKTIYLVQVLLKEKNEICNYAYYENYKDACEVVQHLKMDGLIDADYIRIKEIKVYL